MNNYPNNPYGNQGQQYSPYQQQQTWYGNTSVVGDRATYYLVEATTGVKQCVAASLTQPHAFSRRSGRNKEAE